jgi:hypothetical protein
MMKPGRIATRWPLLPGQGRSTSETGASEMHDKPLSSASSASPVLPILAGVLAVAIFAIDTISTLDTAIAVLYAVVVLMGANFLQRRGFCSCPRPAWH